MNMNIYNPGLIILGWGIGQLMGVYLFSRPRILKVIKYDEKNRTAIYKLKTKDTYSKKFTFYNLDCLSTKGYNTQISQWNNNKLTITNTKIEENKFIEQLEKDCRECNLYMDFKYKYLTIFLHDKKITKKVYWYDYLDKASYDGI